MLPLLELFNELMLHMEDLREPSELGLLGGVVHVHDVSAVFRSANTCHTNNSMSHHHSCTGNLLSITFLFSSSLKQHNYENKLNRIYIILAG